MGREMPDAEWTVEQKRQMAGALLKCPSLQTRQGRDDVVGQLPEAIRHGIQRRDDAKSDVANILERCLSYEDGLQRLLAALNFYEGDSLPYQDVLGLMREICPGVQFPGGGVSATPLRHPSPGRQYLLIPTEVLAAFLILIASGAIAQWNRPFPAWDARIFVSGTLLALFVLASPAIRLSPVGLRAYRSRLLEPGFSPPLTDVAPQGKGDGESQLRSQRSTQQMAEKLMTWAILLCSVVALLVTLGLAVAVAVVFIDVVVVVLPILAVGIFLVVRLFPAPAKMALDWLSSYGRVPSTLVAESLTAAKRLAPILDRAVQTLVVVLLATLVLVCVGGAAYQMMTTQDWKAEQIFFPMGWIDDPGIDTPNMREGLQYEWEKKYDLAVASYRQEIEANPENAAAYNALAWLYADKLGTNIEEAITLAQQAVALTEKKDVYDKRNPELWLSNYLDTLTA